MTNNDILRRLRYTFDLDDSKMIELFDLGGYEVTRTQVSAWLKVDSDRDAKEVKDVVLAVFLNGFIVDRRGPKDDSGEDPEAEEELNNNMILRKLKIALELQADEVLRMLKTVNITLSNHELSAFFRRPGHKHYRLCKDQVMRNFIHALQVKYRPEAPTEGSTNTRPGAPSEE